MIPYPIDVFSLPPAPSLDAIAIDQMLMKVKMVPTMICIAVFVPESIMSLHSLSGWLAMAVQDK